MEFNAPGVPSKGIPRARARIDCETGGGDVCGSRAWRSGRNSRSARAMSRVEIAFMAKERTSNVQRPTLNETLSSRAKSGDPVVVLERQQLGISRLRSK